MSRPGAGPVGPNWAAAQTTTASGRGVHALAVHDSGHGPRLYVGGLFNIAGGVPATGIARLEGERFAPVTPGAAPNSYASCGLVRREGGADILYCGGNFYTAGEQVAGPLARWDGARWSAIEPLPPFGGVSALGEFDDGTGPVLFVSGSTGFDPNDPHNNLNGLARFDGHAWSGVGGGLTGVTGAKASALAVFDDGTGPALYVGGRFRQAGGCGREQHCALGRSELVGAGQRRHGRPAGS